MSLGEKVREFHEMKKVGTLFASHIYQSYLSTYMQSLPDVVDPTLADCKDHWCIIPLHRFEEGCTRNTPRQGCTPQAWKARVYNPWRGVFPVHPNLKSVLWFYPTPPLKMIKTHDSAQPIKRLLQNHHSKTQWLTHQNVVHHSINTKLSCTLCFAYIITFSRVYNKISGWYCPMETVDSTPVWGKNLY